MGKLRVLCVFVEQPQRGKTQKYTHVLDEATEKLATLFNKKKIHLEYIHVVMRQLDYDSKRWFRVRPAITYTVNHVSHTANTSRQISITVTRTDDLPNAVYEDLETMGGGKRRTLRHLLKDTLDHLYVTEAEMQERDAARVLRASARADMQRRKEEMEAQVIVEESQDEEEDLEAAVDQEQEEDGSKEVVKDDEYWDDNESEAHPSSPAGTKRKASMAYVDESTSTSKVFKTMNGVDE